MASRLPDGRQALTTEISRDLLILNKRGLHARASAAFSKCAGQFTSSIRVGKDGYDVGATSIMGLMLLAASKGSTIRVTINGEDAPEAMAAIEALIADRFGEGE